MEEKKMLEVTIDLTPNRRFCNVKFQPITEHLKEMGFEAITILDNEENIYKNEETKEILIIETNGSISLNTELIEVNSDVLSELIYRCKNILSELNSCYNYALNDDTMFIYWPDHCLQVSNTDFSISDYRVKTYKITDTTFSTIVQKIRM